MPKPLSDEELYFIKTVAEDLRYLREEWDEEIDDHSLRRSSAVLRILLVDDAYGRAWRLLGHDKQPRLRAIALEAVLADPPRTDVSYAQAGGARYRGMEISPVLAGDGVPSDADAAALDAYLAQDFTRDFGIRDFAESACVMGRGQTVKRREVIQQVANRLGGTHLDTAGSGHKSKPAFDVLDQLANIEIAEKPAIYYELLAIGQAVAGSADAATLIQEAAKLP